MPDDSFKHLSSTRERVVDLRVPSRQEHRKSARHMCRVYRPTFKSVLPAVAPALAIALSLWLDPTAKADLFDARPHLLSSPPGRGNSCWPFRFSGWPAGKFRRRFSIGLRTIHPLPGRGLGEGRASPTTNFAFPSSLPGRDLFSHQPGTLSPANFRCHSAAGRTNQPLKTAVTICRFCLI